MLLKMYFLWEVYSQKCFFLILTKKTKYFFSYSQKNTNFSKDLQFYYNQSNKKTIYLHILKKIQKSHVK